MSVHCLMLGESYVFDLNVLCFIVFSLFSFLLYIEALSKLHVIAFFSRQGQWKYFHLKRQNKTSDRVYKKTSLHIWLP